MQETPETRDKLANAIKDLQSKGDTESISSLVSAYKSKYQTSSATYPGKPIVEGAQNFAKSIGEVSQGAIKGVGKTALNTLDVATSLGQGFLHLATGQPTADIQKKSTIPILDPSTPSGSFTQNFLKPATTPEKIGYYGETAAEVAQGAKGIYDLASFGISKLPGAVKATQKEMSKLVDLVSPRMTPSVARETVQNGKVVAPTMTQPAKIDFSKDPQVMKMVDSIKGIVDPASKNVVSNMNKVKSAIENISTRIVAPHLKSNPVPFNFEDFRTALTREMKPSTTLSGETSQTIYNDVREKLLSTVADKLKSTINKTGNVQNLTDFNELWDARKSIDSIAEAELKNFDFGTPQYVGIKTAVQDFRKGFSTFITDSLSTPGQVDKINVMKQFLSDARAHGWEDPLGKDPQAAYKLLEKQMGINRGEEDIARSAVFSDAMERMTNMYNAVENMAPKVVKELGKTGMKLWAEQNPLKAKAIGGTAIGLGFGAEQVVQKHL